jgi:hypothetical protein
MAEVQGISVSAVHFGVMATLDDRPRPGKAAEITDEARAWLVSLAYQKAKELGYSHELRTTRLLARHVRTHAAAVGRPRLANIVQGTVYKILARHVVKPHKVRCYLERRHEAFETKMVEVLCVYREVAVLRESEANDSNVAIISYDETPGIQAIGNTAPDLPPRPRSHATFARDHEYKRHARSVCWPGSTCSPATCMPALRSAIARASSLAVEFIGLLKQFEEAYPADTAIELILDNHSAHISKETSALVAAQPSRSVASPSCSRRRTIRTSTLSKASSPRWCAPCSVTSVSLPRTNSRPGSSPTSMTSTAIPSPYLDLHHLRGVPTPTYDPSGMVRRHEPASKLKSDSLLAGAAGLFNALYLILQRLSLFGNSWANSIGGGGCRIPARPDP